ncbi:hypothetical protein ANCDUO_25087 [Ancylostoma duodenale]|uniref:Peptidase M13 C-terminal domain-containing protein n=1 Tax=Ancylostoma duodenale TaxID=51022 RepID=A0A0C2F8V7_9BILA|nr:hypothetical protein ANCDUO_25087 [Ancylostoma duodenale]
MTNSYLKIDFETSSDTKFIQICCGHVTKDAAIRRILVDPHSPMRYRVNQVLANQPEFAAAFQCKVGTPMNPTERCAVW